MAIAVAVPMLFAPALASADVAWDDPDGETDTYSWANGHNSDTNLFGSPSYYGGDNLYFLDTNFAASADDGTTSNIAADTLNVDLFAHPGLKFASCSWFWYGDYNITGPEANHVSADFDMWAYVPGHPMDPFHDDFLFTAAGDTGGTVPWQDGAALLMEFAVPPVTELHLTLTNTLMAVSDGAGGTASIEGQVVLAGLFQTVVLPEPASLSLLTLGGLFVTRRRR
jgi:hypothetical protein